MQECLHIISEAPRFAFIKGTGGIKAPPRFDVRRQQ
jgi:hypothetical protein